MQLEMDILEAMARDDNTETVQYTSRRRAAAGGDVVADIHGLRRHMVSVKEQAQSGGAYAAGDMIFSGHARYLPDNFESKLGDWLADDKGIRYTVISFDRRRRDGKDFQGFKLQVRDLRIHYDLQDIITIETPVLAQTITGAGEVTNWEPKYVDLACKVQKITETTAEERAILGTKGSYAVTVEREVVVTMRDRVIVGTPSDNKRPAFEGGDANRVPQTVLTIVGYRAADSIMELPVIECEASP